MTNSNGNNAEGHNGEQSGVLSVETGWRILDALSGCREPQMLKELAERAHMHPSKAHRYLVSFIRTGLVDRDPASGRYRWGPMALKIGVAALASINVVRMAAPEIERLRNETGATVALAVWGGDAPTHIMLEESQRAVVVKSQLGVPLPLLNSATGRIFSAYLPPEVVKKTLEREIAASAKNAAGRKKTLEEYEKSRHDVRKTGISRAIGDHSPGVHSLAAPVFDHKRSLAAAVVILAPAGEFDPSRGGAAAASLRVTANKISMLLGYNELSA